MDQQSQITIPITPKPTKAAVVAAAVERARQTYNERSKAHYERIDRLKIAAKQTAQQEFNLPVLPEYVGLTWGQTEVTQSVEVTLHFPFPSGGATRKAVSELEDADFRLPPFDAKKVATHVRDQLNGNSTTKVVEAILANQTCVDELDRLLQE